MKRILLLLCLGLPAYGMEGARDVAKDALNKARSYAMPYAPAVASFVVARYTPELAATLIPDEYASTKELLPLTLSYGGNSLGALLLAKNVLGKKYMEYTSAIAKTVLGATPALLCHPAAKTAVSNACMTLAQNKLSPEQMALFGSCGPTAVSLAGASAAAYLTMGAKAANLAPALLCNPTVAQAATNGCISLVQNHISENTATTLQTYLPTALMVAGGATAAYLTYNNVIKNIDPKTCKKVKKVAQRSAFMLPVAGYMNSTMIANTLMQNVPFPPTLKSDTTSILTKGLEYAALGGAGYLIAKYNLKMATRADVKREFQAVKLLLQDLCAPLNLAKENLASAQSTNLILNKDIRAQVELLKENGEETNKQLNGILTLITELHEMKDAEVLARQALLQLLEQCKIKGDSLEEKLPAFSEKLVELQLDTTQTCEKLIQLCIANNINCQKTISECQENLARRFAVLAMLCQEQNDDVGSLEKEFDVLTQALVELQNVRTQIIEPKMNQIEDLLEQADSDLGANQSGHTPQGEGASQ